VAGLQDGVLRFEVTKPKINWRTYFGDLMRPKFGGGFEDYSRGSPAVIAENARGDRRVIAVLETQQDAKSKAAVIESDLETLGVAAWCERYGVPPDFVT
jgi:hypothetical protein